MGIKTKTITKVPFWARMYLTYGEEAAPEDADDRKLVDDFKDELEREGLRLICPIDGTYSEFEPFPKFGLACDTEDWTAEVLPKMHHPFEERRSLRAVRETCDHRKEST